MTVEWVLINRYKKDKRSIFSRPSNAQKEIGVSSFVALEKACLANAVI